ncbi:MAG: T9SS type A sorting domain-containing protein [Bacteroidota bacterium]
MRLYSVDVSNEYLMVSGHVLYQATPTEQWRGFTAKIQKDDLQAVHWTYYSPVMSGGYANFFHDIHYNGGDGYIIGGNYFNAFFSVGLELAWVNSDGSGICNPINFSCSVTNEPFPEEPAYPQTIPHAGFAPFPLSTEPLHLQLGNCSGFKRSPEANPSTPAPDALSDLQLWPNPATDQLHLEGTALEQVRQLNIVDMTGRQIQVHHSADFQTLDVQHLPRGTYFLQLDLEDGRKMNRKFICQ